MALIERSCENCGNIFTINESRLKQGRGKNCSKECQYALRKGRPNIRDFKGVEATTGPIHEWVRRNWGRPEVCEWCGEKDQMVEWANLDHEYQRVRKDWAQLCRPCHRRYDIDSGIMGKRVDSKTKRPDKYKTECKAGHPLSGDNLYIDPRGNRYCRACRTRRRKEFNARTGR